jgi:putative ABC transport system ATP-binding protein
VALPLVLAGESQAASALVAIATLAGLGLEALADRLPEEVSAGQAQRAGIARAIASRPRLLLADEPTGQLDQAAAHHVTRVLVGAARDLGAALLLSTHDEGVASTFSSRWEMVDGRLDTNASAWSR